MAKLLRYLFLLVFAASGTAAFAQTGAISGKVKDEKGEPVIGAIVEASLGGSVRGGAATDFDGNYTIKPLNAATNYTITVKYTGYQEVRLNNVIITSDRTTYQNFNLKLAAQGLDEVVVTEYKVPLIKKDEPGTSTTYTKEQILKMPTLNTSDVASLSGGTYQAKSGAALSIGGARTNGTLYIIDGIQVNGSTATNLPPGSIDQMSVITSGIPAKYGDALGGVVSITTTGPSNEMRGNVRLEHSVDGYNHNLASLNLSGPLLKKSIDSLGSKKTILGYALGLQYVYDEDGDPNYFDNYVVKPEVLDQIRNRPLVPIIGNSGQRELRYAAEDVTMADMETSKQRINADYQNIRGNGNLDFQVSDNANLRLGGNYSYINSKAYSKFYSLFAPDAMPYQKNITGRAFLRFTQRLGSTKYNTNEEDEKPSLISNAFYSVQADYQRNYSETEDPNHGKDLFLYSYLGKFKQNYTTLYAIGEDTNIYGKDNPLLLNQIQTRFLPTGVEFTRTEHNPYLANYTSAVYDLTGPQMSLQEILQRRGLLNGDLPTNVYTLYGNTGRGFTGYNYDLSEQFAFNVDASFDMQLGKTRHAIEFGLYYQQRAERFYSAGRPGTAVNIWNTMRSNVNAHIIGLDFGNPIYIKDGKQYTKEDVKSGMVVIGTEDTVIYPQRFDEGTQSFFSKNLREKLGLDPKGLDYINIDEIDPSLLSLDMFSADELLNNGERFVNYYGYDYKGNRLNGQVNFNDWFTKKDEFGNYTREVGAFRPNYIAGYIMDKFELSNGTLFNIGVRVERFDANTKVLKDPYSLYATHTVATSDAINNINGGAHPSNIGDDYIVYVKNNAAEMPEVVGYRNGDEWFDPYGRLLDDPSNIERLYSDNNPIQPYLEKNSPDGSRALTMRDEGYNPNSSFTDYTPQVNVMPRFSFTFPIADQSMFYAHYDIIVQRPKSVGQIYATPYDYYFMTQNAAQIIPNPDLKPEKLFDYELGFQQALNRYSAVTISGFYKERKDMIQVRPYLYAFPITYYTYGNRDFSTTKGTVIKYEMRRNNHLSALLTYTLQFVEGTASSANESNGGLGTIQSSGLLQNLIGAQLPNLRFAYPLNVDSRHIINANIDYRYDDNEGPMIGNVHILENMGANLIFRARSGEPYTPYINAIPGNTTIEGGVQSARLPWHNMFDLRVDKQFKVFLGKKDESMINRKSLNLMAFVYVTNLFNNRDVLGVHRYTGRPDDNGFLASANGQQAIGTQLNQQAYIDQYMINTQTQGFLNNPRRINIGLQVGF